MLVLLEMAVKVGLLTEAAVAQVTLEGLLLVVDVANVTLKVGRDAEGAIAVFTPIGRADVRTVSGGLPAEVSGLLRRAVPVGLLSCVRSQVSGEVCRSREDFPAVPGGRERTEKEVSNLPVKRRTGVELSAEG